MVSPKRERGGRAGGIEAAALTTAMIVMFAGVTLVTPLLPQYQARWHLATSTSTLVFVAYVGGVVFALVALGRLADAVGSGPVLLAAFVLGDLATLVAVVATAEPWLVVVRVLHGIGVGMVPGATAIALTSTGARPRVVSLLLSAATTSGIALGLILGGLLAGTGTTTAWLIYAAALAVVTVNAATRARPSGLPDSNRGWSPQRPAVPERGRRGLFATTLLATAVAFGAIGLFAGLGPMLATPTGQGDHDRTSAALLGATIAAAAYLVSGLAQICSARHVARTRPGATVLILGLVSLLIAVRSEQTPLLSIAAMLIGTGNGLLFPPTLRIANELASDERRGGVVSTYYLAMYAGIALPLLVLGVVADHTSVSSATQIVTAAIGAVALAVLVLDPAPPRPSVIGSV